MADHRRKTAAAALAALTAALAWTAAGAAELAGRLFFTPDQRARLEQARARGEPPPPPPAPAAPAAAQPKREPPPLITVDGVVRSADGRTVVWINKKPGDHEVKPVPVPGQASRVRIELGEDLGSAELRVGQRYDRISGRIEEPYEIPPPPPAPPATPPSERLPAAQPQAASGPPPEEEPAPAQADEAREGAASAAEPSPMAGRRY